MRVVRVDPVAQEFVDELLCQCPHLHIRIHIQVLDLESVGFEHFSDSYDVWMDLSP